MSWEREVRDIEEKRRLALKQGGPAGVSRQHNAGRKTIRERIDNLIDQDSFHEMGAGAGATDRNPDGSISSFSPANFVLGFGELDGRHEVGLGGDRVLGAEFVVQACVRSYMHGERA